VADYMQITCTLLQTDNQPAPDHSFFMDQMLFLMPNQQCYNTESNSLQCSVRYLLI